MTTLIDRLHPRPQKLRLVQGHLELPSRSVIRLPDDDSRLRLAARRISEALAGHHCDLAIVTEPTPSPAQIDVRIDPERIATSQAYNLAIDRTGVSIVASDLTGSVYGMLTLAQLLATSRDFDNQHPRTVECAVIDDWPDFEHRGVLLDISRDRVPTMEWLYSWIEMLAGWKINQIQLYMEHTFAYGGHEVVWRNADPLTADEIRSLDAYCLERCIELVPNQNSFGHLHRWLVHAPYRALAECPEGVDHPFNETPEPFSLCAVDPRSLELLEDLYDQLLPNFTSSQFNVGLDETFDLGLGRSAEACRQRGRERVYLDYLKAVHRLVEDRDHRMQFWADILLENPPVIDELPPSVIPLAWGYEANHPFEDNCEILAESGLDFYVCPGTSSWNSFAGRTTNAFGNLCGAALAGRDRGASGYLITDWGDFGHMQPPSVSLPGLLIGAGCAWNATVAADAGALRKASPDLLDRWALAAPQSGLGEIALALGDTYRHTGAEIKNGSILFFLLLFAGESLQRPRYEALTQEGLESASRHVDSVLTALTAIRLTSDEMQLAKRELTWVARILSLACRLGKERLLQGRNECVTRLPAAVRSDLHADLT
ncbi:MAG: family 20 glycosylhydrolase, partial [Acidobacteriota bacterium]